MEDGGVKALFERTRRKPNLANRVDEITEQAVIKNAIDFPAYGQARTSNELRKLKHPQTNGICERFHKTILQEFYQVTFRKKVYSSIGELQADLDQWIDFYNNERTHQGKMCCGRTPFEAMMEGKDIWRNWCFEPFCRLGNPVEI